MAADEVQGSSGYIKGPKGLSSST